MATTIQCKHATPPPPTSLLRLRCSNSAPSIIADGLSYANAALRVTTISLIFLTRVLSLAHLTLLVLSSLLMTQLSTLFLTSTPHLSPNLPLTLLILILGSLQLSVLSDLSVALQQTFGSALDHLKHCLHLKLSPINTTGSCTLPKNATFLT